MKHLQINTFKHLFAPTVQSTVTIEQWLNQIKESDHSDFITQSRLTTGAEYDNRKKQMPCVSYNFLYDQYKNNENTTTGTGLMYIDIDDENFNISNLDTSKVFAYYKSFGGKGYAIIVRAEGLTLDNFNSTYFEILTDLGLMAFFDKNAMKATQFNVLSFDKDLFYNANSFVFEASIDTVPPSIVIEKKRRTYTTEGGTPNTNNYNSIRFNNLSDIEIPEGEYVVNWDGYDFINCFIPMKKFNAGSRNNFLLGYCNNLVYLNADITKERAIQIMSNVNSFACAEPVTAQQVIRVVNSIFKYKVDGTLEPKYFWKKRKIIFKPTSKLSREEKLEICRAELSIKRSSDSRSKLIDILNSWDFKSHGNVSHRNICKFNKISKKTVQKYYAEFADFIVELNTQHNVTEPITEASAEPILIETTVVPRDETTLTTEPQINLAQLLNEFIAKDRTYFINQLGKNKIIYDKLIEIATEDDLEKLFNELDNYSFTTNLKFEFVEFCEAFTNAA